MKGFGPPDTRQRHCRGPKGPGAPNPGSSTSRQEHKKMHRDGFSSAWGRALACPPPTAHSRPRIFETQGAHRRHPPLIPVEPLAHLTPLSPLSPLSPLTVSTAYLIINPPHTSPSERACPRIPVVIHVVIHGWARRGWVDGGATWMGRDVGGWGATWMGRDVDGWGATWTHMGRDIHPRRALVPPSQ